MIEDYLEAAKEQVEYIPGAMSMHKAEYMETAHTYALIAIAESLDALVSILASEQGLAERRSDLFCRTLAMNDGMLLQEDDAKTE